MLNINLKHKNNKSEDEILYGIFPKCERSLRLSNEA